ncbi:O-antigen polymerase [Candidatus Symbiobacter mobilis CR]|uniref:O-antigen polymerase n=2 Tax=Candidatus Symbiobacter TaxID=1436289 RepID=U5N8N3_9BURK|nr:O-antigen polymerase [Candidatus Symbiobacter mobilis CR]
MPAVVPLLASWGCAAGLAMLWAVGQPDRERMAHAIAWAWAIAAVLSAAIGLMQYTGTSDWMGRWASHPGTGQAYGNLRQRNQFATLMNIGLAALLWFAGTLHRGDARPRSTIRSTGCSDDGIAASCAGEAPPLSTMSAMGPVSVGPMSMAPTWPVRARWAMRLRSVPWAQWAMWAWLLAAACVIGLGNAASSSRTGLVQLALLGALAALWGGLRPAVLRTVGLVWAVAAGAYLLGNVALPWWLGVEPASHGALARLQAGDPPCASRLTLWRNVLYLIAQRPWAGWGWDELDYAHFVTLYPHPRFCDILDNAHNLPLHLAVELGAPIAVLWTGLIVWAPLRARFWKDDDPTRQLAWSVLALILLHSLLEYPLWYGPFQIAVVLSLYLLWPRVRGGLWLRAVQGLAALLLGGYCVVAAWQYELASQIYLPPEQRLPGYKEDTLDKTLDVVLFRDQVLFAELTMTTAEPHNAASVYALSRQLLHFSPEPRVVERLIDSTRMLGQQEEADFYTLRFRAAFPDAWAHWVARQPAKQSLDP